MKTFKLFYHISNNGDGSVSLQLHQTEKEADIADEEAIESGDCFAESTADMIELKYDIQTQKILYKDYDTINGKYQKVWKECKFS